MPEVLGTLFVIAVPDLARSSAYYRDILGFEANEVGDPGWRMFECGACRILAGECPDALPAAELGDHSYFAYLRIEGVNTYCARLEAAGVEFVKQLRSEPWGMREFGIRTIDGHRIMFGERIDEGE